MSEKRKVPILNSLRRPSSPRSKASEEAFNISPISPRVEWKPPKPWSSIGFEQNMILRNDIPPPPPGPPPHYHDLIGPPGLSKSVQTASLFVPSEVSKSNKEASDVAPPPLKVKHFSQVLALHAALGLALTKIAIGQFTAQTARWGGAIAR